MSRVPAPSSPALGRFAAHPAMLSAVVLVAILLSAMTLRAPLTSVSVLLDGIRVDLALGHAGAGLLNAIPTFCMGLFAFFGAHLVMRLGLERSIAAAVGLIALATALRGTGGFGAVFIGSTLIGIGIAFAQSLIPALIKQQFPGRTAQVNGFYTAAMHTGAALGAASSVPLAGWLGGWPAALGVWALVAGLALVFWAPLIRQRAARPNGLAPVRLPWREPLAWRLTAFFALSSSVYFCVVTWVAPLYGELGYAPAAAGLVLTLLTGAQIVGSLIIPSLAQRTYDRRPWLAVNLAAIGIGALGAALIPETLSLLWALLMGIGLGGLFPLTLTLPLDYSADARAAGRLNAMMFGVGLTVAGFSPYLAGGLREASGGYAVPFLVLTGLVGLMAPLVFSFRPGRPTAVPGEGR